jgi:DNA repair protein RadC
LELLLTYAIPRRDVKPLAKELIERFKNLAAVFDAPLQALQEVPGIGHHAAVLIALVPQLLKWYQKERWGERRMIGSTQDAVLHLSPLLSGERNESFYILALDSRNTLLATESIQHGTVNRAAVFPRQVVEASVKHRATALILAHNHPGGDPNPSQSDRLLTQKLKKILGDLDITVHDHIIIAGLNYYSFSENGAL